MKRILYLIYNLERGGIQQWLMNVLRHVDCPVIDIVIFQEVPSPYIDELNALGIKVILCKNHRNIFLFSRNFLRILKTNNYNIIHSHTSYHSGVELMLAYFAGVKTRITHIHSDLSKIPCNSILRKLYQYIMRTLIKIFATIVADSQQKGASLFGKKGISKSTVIYCGIDFSLFKKAVSKNNIKTTLGIPTGKKVIGHVGRFAYPKNHKFILEIFAELSNKCDNFVLVLVGSGELQEEMESYASHLQIKDKVIFAGERSDVPAILKGAFDLFLFPSHYEGSALAIIEALAAGLPCVISDVIAEESRVIPELIHPTSLASSTAIWASEIEKILDSKKSFSKEKAFELILQSNFTIEKSVQSILRLYE